jgi:hypothetical protein
VKPADGRPCSSTATGRREDAECDRHRVDAELHEKP